MAKYCTECGNIIQGTSKYCTECGSEINKSTSFEESNNIKSDIEERIHSLMKAYLIYGILSILIATSILFGLQIFNSVIIGGEILIVIGGIFLIIAYELIFKGKKYVTIATTGCIFGVVGSFFPTVEAIRDWYEYSSSIIFPILFFTIFIIYLIFLIATLLWRPKTEGTGGAHKFMIWKK